MPKFGAHMSIAGGCFRCMEWGQQAGCDVVQLFSKNERQWLGKPLTDDDIAKFTDARTRTNVQPVMIHDSYLINLSSPNDDLWEKSINAFRDELLRARALGVP
ncbi:MAG TPA: TIM barrel protein, partial [Thermomicrobiales bacterium]